MLRNGVRYPDCDRLRESHAPHTPLRRLLYTLILLATVTACVPKPAPSPPVAPPNAIIYGDSITGSIASLLVSPSTVVHASAGFSPCAWLYQMRPDAVHAPHIVILDFIGNYGWPCQVGSRHDAYLHDYQTIRSMFPSTTKVLITIPPAIFAPASPNSDVAQAVLDSGLPTIDARALFGGESPDPSLRTPDGVHLSATGQTLYASILLASLKMYGPVVCLSLNCPTPAT
jgi:hypothetical protein